MRKIWKRAQPKIEKKFKYNQQIKTLAVFLIDENGVQIGSTPTEKALAQAQAAELDLVEVNPTADPPVVKIMDYGQFKYEQEKKSHKQKVQHKKVDTKGIRLSVRISAHDFDFRLEQAKKFLEKGNKLKVELNLKGRERQHLDKAAEVINDFVKKLESTEGLNLLKEQPLTRQGGRFNIVLVNKKQ